MRRILKIIGTSFIVIFAIILVLSHINHLFISDGNEYGLPKFQRLLEQKPDHNHILNLVNEYNKKLPLAIGNGLNKVCAKFNADENYIVFYYEGGDSIIYEESQNMILKIKLQIIRELLNVIVKRSDPLITALYDAKSTFKYKFTADKTLNCEIEITHEDLKRFSMQRENSIDKDYVILCKDYLKEYVRKINSHMPDINNDGEGAIKVEYDVENNILIWYNLTMSDQNQADEAYNHTLIGLKETYFERTDAVVDAIVETNGKMKFIYLDSKGKEVFSYTITGRDISKF